MRVIPPIKDTFKELVSKVQRLAHIADKRSVKKQLEDVRPEDLADAITRVEPEEAASVLQAMDVLQAGEVMVEMPTETARQIVDHLPDDVLAAYLDVLPMDDALDLREELGDERFEALLEVIPEEDAKEIRRLMTYPEGSVGRIMTEKFFEIRAEQTVAEILTDLRLASDDKYESVNNMYVLDDEGKLGGVVSLKRALRVDPGTRAEEIMNTDVIWSLVTDDEESAARKMSRYGLYSLPVVDEEHRVLGVLTGDDAQTILQDADTEDVLAVGGVTGDAEPYMSLNVWQLFKRRVPWLMALFVAESFTGSVLRFYGQNDTDLKIAPLTFFIPLLIGAGGNSGAQVTTTITRSLALGDVDLGDIFTIMAKELTTASMVGGSLGLMAFVRAWAPAPLGWHSGVQLALVVGLSLPAIVVWATVVGSLVPMGAKKVGIDPAVMSAPFITTFVDATGLIIYFEIALRILHSTT